MSLFSGEYDIKLDGKGRVILPARIKARIETKTLVVVKGFEPCLDCYIPDEWNLILQKLGALNSFVEENRNLQRNIISRSIELDIDSAGRVVLPQRFLEYAHITTDAILLGVGNKFELWERKQLDRYQITSSQELSRLAEKLLN
jgi:MraZ protein